jgi:hypothetical protein
VSDTAAVQAAFAPRADLSVTAVAAELPNLRLDSDPVRIFIRRWVKVSARGPDAKPARVAWSVEEGEAAGRISLDGTYTAPAQPGTYHLVATSLDDAAARGQIAVEVVTTQNLYDYRGRILPAPKLLLIWRGARDDFAGAIPLYERFLAGVNGSPWLSVLDQYMRGERASVSVAGEIMGAAAAPGETDPESALCALLASRRLTPDATTVYTLLSPAAAQAFDHHSSVVCEGVRVPTIAVSLRRDAPHPSGACTEALSPAERMLWAFSHELAEVITDPEPSSGWTDVYGQEVADDCARATCQSLATGTFSLSSLLSNSAGGCAP